MGGSKAAQPSASKEQENRSQALFDTWNPMQTQLAGQGTELLKTGGVGAMIPMLTTLMNSARAGVSRSNQSLSDSLGRGRLGATPYGQRLKMDQSMQGEQNVAMTIPNFFQWFLPQVMNSMTGNTATANNGMSSVTGAETSRVNANAANTTSQYNTGVSTAGQMFKFTGAL